ncbi:hypothetical protein RRG08_030068 [Elysia crispata]|uniref:Uncharacterized protein n=1 Tax=Elysia crispata TaxID=231223 RepID=A0AAE0YKR3_9GAST|nr:hypothetical protein RRG08_030068 [Elysia crispata]
MTHSCQTTRIKEFEFVERCDMDMLEQRIFNIQGISPLLGLEGSFGYAGFLFYQRGSIGHNVLEIFRLRWISVLPERKYRTQCASDLSATLDFCPTREEV